MNLRLVRWLAAAGLLWLAGQAGAANHTVEVGGPFGFSYSPASLTIKRGDTVTFVNRGGVHNVVADDNSFRCSTTCASSGNPNGGNAVSGNWSQTVTFNDAGTKGYYCSAHGAAGGVGMSGRIIVEDNGTPPFVVGPSLSGNWFNPAQNGHGFQFEVVNETTAIVIWFTFDNAGNQAWIFGSGTIDGNRLVMQAVKSSGGRFPPNFNPANITNPPWGTLTFTFTGCNAGKVDWTSVDANFTASGTMPLERVTSIAGVTCPQ